MNRVAKHLIIFNHKGGVGKTTLTVNVAAALAEDGYRVLVIDTDPQCNLTSYLLSDDVVDDLLDNSDTEHGKTIWTALKPVLHGIGPYKYVEPIQTVIENVFLLPGDIRLSEYEQFLGEQWTGCLQRRVGALRATASISMLACEISRKQRIDYVFYDTGPNIGPLNRVLLLDADFFVVPVACDLFSIRALSTLGQKIKQWIIDWNTISSLAPDDSYLLPGHPRFLGYIPQRFKVYGQEMANAPWKYLRSLKPRVYSDLISVLGKLDERLVRHDVSDPKIGQVKEFGVLVQEAQRQGVPLSEVKHANENQKLEASRAFVDIADSISKGIVAFESKQSKPKPRKVLRRGTRSRKG